MKPVWRRGVIYIALLGAEYCWLYALLSLANRLATDGRLSILGLLLLYPVAFIFNKLLPLPRRRFFRFCLYALNGLAWAAGMLLLVKIQLYGRLGLFEPAWLWALPQAMSRITHAVEPEVLLLMGSIFVWWLGWHLARLKVNFATSVAEFQFGVSILLAVFLTAYLSKVQLANSIAMALLFFLFALVGMSLAHAQEGAGWLTGSNRGLWLGLTLGGIGLVLVLGLVVGSVVTHDFLQLVLIPIKWVINMVYQGFDWAMDLLWRLFPVPKETEIPPELFGASPTATPREALDLTIPEPYLSWLRLGYTVFVLGVIFFALWRVSSDVLAWLRRKLAGTTGAEVESLPGAFRADLLNLLRRMVLSLLRFRLPWRRKKPESPPSGVTLVRQIYRELLRWAAGGGWPRNLSQTPHEYLHTLKDLLPVAGEELSFITEQYVSARYGPRFPTEEELYQLRQSWSRLRQNRVKPPKNGLNHG